MAPAGDPVRVAEPAPAAVPPREIDFTGRRVCATGADIPLCFDERPAAAAPERQRIHPKVGIGPNGLLFQQVAFGTGGPVPGAPVLAGHVDIGGGDKGLGGVKVGAHVVIVANAVVLCDVPADGTAVGIPARFVARGEPVGPASQRPA